MPTCLLPIEHQVQEVEFGCLAACASMLLNELGIAASQEELNHLLDLQTGGVPYTRLERLSRYRVNVAMHAGDDSQLRRLLDQRVLPIIFVHTNQLTSYWVIATRHAVVVSGYDDDHFYLNDPASADAPKQVPVD